MTSLKGCARRASKRASSLSVVPESNRKRPAFALLNGPLMARARVRDHAHLISPWSLPRAQATLTLVPGALVNTALVRLVVHALRRRRGFPDACALLSVGPRLSLPSLGPVAKANDGLMRCSVARLCWERTPDGQLGRSFLRGCVRETCASGAGDATIQRVSYAARASGRGLCRGCGAT
jgi:hypothetical protein